MTKARQAVGAYGERLAERHLTEQGLTVLDRNWRCARGEIDLILTEGEDTLVFCEVKTRRSDRFGTPAEQISRAKVLRLRRLAALWLQQSDRHATEVRFDVVSVRPQPRGAAEVEHLRGAF